MRVLHLSTADSGGGAFRAAYRLHTGLRRQGVDSRMLVLKKGTSDERVFAYKPLPGLLARWQRNREAGKIWRDYEKYRTTIPLDVEPFSDDRSPYVGLTEQVPECDLINLHWIGGFLDWRDLLSSSHGGVPIVWRLADMGAFTGGCHYDQGCGRFADKCGACPQLGSQDDNDLSRQIWLRKRRSLDDRGIQIVGPSHWIANEAKRSSLFGSL